MHAEEEEEDFAAFGAIIFQGYSIESHIVGGHSLEDLMERTYLGKAI